MTVTPASPGDWVAHAACDGATHTMAMLEGEAAKSAATVRAHIAAAKAICATCPVFDPCRTWAMSEPDPAYALIAGGLTPNERRIANGRPVRRWKTA